MRGNLFLVLFTMALACDAYAEYNPEATRYFGATRLPKTGAEKEPGGVDERRFDFEVVRLPGREVFKKSLADNVDPQNRLDYETLRTHPLGEAYEASREAKEKRDNLLDLVANGGEDWAEYRLSHSQLMLKFMQAVHDHTWLDIDIENRQPGGPGTPNKFFVDIGFDFGQNNKPRALQEATGKNGKDRQFEFEWGPRFSGLSKPPALRFEALFYNNGNPLDFDLTVDPFDQEIQLDFKRQKVQSTDIRFAWGYGDSTVSLRLRQWLIKDFLSLRSGMGFDYGAGNFYTFASFQGSF